MSDPRDETEYRTELTPAEAASLDPRNPARLQERVRIVVPESGRTDEARVKIIFTDGREQDMINVVRVVVSLEPTSCPNTGPGSQPGTAMAMITLFNNEIGKFQFWIAECVLNYPAPLILTTH